MNFQKFFPSKYLNAVDLEGQGDVNIAIRSLAEESVQGSDGTTDNKPVLRFEGTEKGLILNRTNAETIARLYGNDIENWTGKRIVLYVEHGVQAFGKVWDVVRVRGSVPNESAGTAASPSSSSTPQPAHASPDDSPELTEGALPF